VQGHKDRHKYPYQLDPDDDAGWPDGLTPDALSRRGWTTFEEVRRVIEKQRDDILIQAVAPVKKPAKSACQNYVNKSDESFLAQDRGFAAMARIETKLQRIA